MNKYKLFLVSCILLLSSCVDLFEPAIQNNRDVESMYGEPRFAQGIIINGYVRIPTNSWSFNDMATDDAVSNSETNPYFTVATGQWAADNNPLDQWTNSRAAIQYLNIMLDEVERVSWSEDEVVRNMFNDRIKGEAYGLRALFMFHLLQAHGGRVGGELLGVPLVLEPEGTASLFNIPRATFEQSMQQLYEDVESALDLLPMDYNNIGNTQQIPEKYRAAGADADDYNRVFGQDARQLMSGRIVRAIRAQAALLAASPAFSSSNSTRWEDAANYAAEVIDLNGGLSGLAPNGVTWFTNTGEINAIGSGINPPEILWRTDLQGPNNDLESQHYPPTLFGNGLLNPTQNLVNAFPMANGYPVTHPASNYDQADPYSNRDPRLRHFIIVNGGTAGPNNTVVRTALDAGTIDGFNQVETSTRTGYYMRKLLRQDVNLDPVSTNSQLRYKPRIRYTEIYLIYAEAANEAWGPLGTGGNGYSAYDVIKAIRTRAGIGTDNGDAYLESIKGDQTAMREMIRNERRLELCFEGFRFWDLRRWMSNLTEPAQGVRIQNSVHQYVQVENRVFGDHMIYGPIPLSELLKFNALQQNSGW
ncbi:RagB/SusD family nutrient uptake outer membrane protein [Anditalea andensis]|uniref:Glycan metabolism protein RagB n=1 Tax=Anditalea andensis TaxID=1048983 RepID=A0A074LIZ9_9BACT|nr:RagB/SusD family nutrient uptake outer membrane protein [Anditalea andensis]KEO73782.1 glycan metabolism protein RagB [Anditalea andensis]